ncbi:hypothetical protein SPI_05592 [Niveomyces insectorum RCEF 264]|uniref:Uncharacterized protein n=1 Tax=Niveomyces insectorum RCEF 264 TaxID=1081102 RepID=A0A167TCW2_9HYPO|nr:hypothetical protein SPI_05592 [Niveomyces insectorum RCEF 264]
MPKTAKVRKDRSSVHRKDTKKTHSGSGNGSGAGGSGHRSSRTWTKDIEKKSGYISIACALYIPAEGTKYHWALVFYSDNRKSWYICQVFQEGDEFYRASNSADPTASSRLTHLVYFGMVKEHKDTWKNMIALENSVTIPSISTNTDCQNFVLDLWRLLCDSGYIDEDVWQYGVNAVSPFYGDVIDRSQQQQEPKSAEFIDPADDEDDDDEADYSQQGTTQGYSHASDEGGYWAADGNWHSY